MINWSAIVKKLNISQTRVSVSGEVTGTKEGIVSARMIQKVHDYIKLPNRYNELAAYSSVGMIGFQFEVSLSENFNILNYADYRAGLTEAQDNLIQGGFLTVKWRVGTLAYRYLLLGNTECQLPWGYSIPSYEGQEIKKNCVFEFWTTGLRGEESFHGFNQDILFKTSLIRDPVNGEKTVGTITIGTLVTFAQMSYPVPHAIDTEPEDYTKQAYLNNI